jgi:energy-coupling factor transport system ATP-binding protein
MRDTPFAQRALRDADLIVHDGSSHALMGGTGSGKTTLLQHLNGLYRPQEGSVTVGDYDLGDPDVDLKEVRRHAGLVFQRPEAQIFEQYVGDEIAYGPRLAGLEGKELRDRVRWAMDLVGLDFDGFKDRFTFALSGGEQRKVAVASTLALQPQILLLDEPTAGLDPASRQELIEHLRHFRATGMTMVLSSHQMEDVVALAERATVMATDQRDPDQTDAGTTVAHGSVAEIFGRGDQLRSWGLDQPIVSEIAERLRERGWQLPSGIITQSDLVDYVRRCL